MDIIFAVSPDYLEPLYTEAKKYDFCLQGYGAAVSARQGLLKTNVADILGFIYVADELLDEPDELVSYLNTLNMISRGSRRKMIFALQHNKGLADILHRAEIENLDIVMLNGLEVVTDTVINKQLYGSILLDNYDPYELVKHDKSTDFGQTKLLQYKPLFSDYVLKCLAEVETFDTYEETCVNDGILQEYCQDKSDLAKIRDAKIRKLFDLPFNKGEILDILEKRKEAEEYCMVRALISTV